MLGFVIRHLGTEIVISVYSKGVLQAEVRVPVSTPELTPDGLERIREIYFAKLAAVLGAV
jgi:hypothetical protein